MLGIITNEWGPEERAENRIHVQSKVIIGNLTLTTHSKFFSCLKLRKSSFYERVTVMKNEL